MKVLDPQAALLTTGEIHQFLTSIKPRSADKKIGAYNSVNLHNYNVVRKDVETYLQTNQPHVLTQPPPEEWMKSLLQQLKKYDLTKAEVFALINLGVGFHEGQPASVGDEEANGDTNKDQNGTTAEPHEEENAASESSLDRMLFGLVVEEADERFAGDDGEERIAEILSAIKETAGVTEHNGNNKRINGD